MVMVGNQNYNNKYLSKVPKCRNLSNKIASKGRIRNNRLHNNTRIRIDQLSTEWKYSSWLKALK